MARMYPDLSESTLARMAGERRTRAEVLVYRALRALPDRVLVRYRVPWVSASGEPADGEADFVLFDPRHGILAIEVKGGGIAYDAVQDTWTSTDGDGVIHAIDPFRQATTSKYELFRHLCERPEWKAAAPRRITLAHAVFFPDLSRRDCNRQLRDIATPPAIVGTRDDLTAIEAWIDRCFAEFRRPDEAPLGDRGVRCAEGILCRSITVRPLAARAIEDEERTRLTLTENQMLVLELLAHRNRVGISGGAGTGKTLLARTRSEQLAAAGRNTLLVCFNKPLAAWLQRSVQGAANLTVSTLHALYTSWIAEAGRRCGRSFIDEAEADHPGKDHFAVILPIAFTLAIVEIGAPPYDAVIVDEGQDLYDDDWTALDFMIEARHAALWIFFDPNQILYRRARTFPIRDPDAIFPLRRNCRNTAAIHAVVYRHYPGEPPLPPGIDGVLPEHHQADTLDAQARVVQGVVRRYLAEGVSAADIVVLVLPTDERNQAFFRPLRATTLPDGVQWTFDTFGDPRKVLVDTVARFKGLEGGVLVLWLGVDIDVELHSKFLYVGTSRARSRLVLVGTEQVCKAALAEDPAPTT